MANAQFARTARVVVYGTGTIGMVHQASACASDFPNRPFLGKNPFVTVDGFDDAAGVALCAVAGAVLLKRAFQPFISG